MNKTIHFIKMHGVGNDYIFVDTDLYPIEHPEEVSIAWSRHHFGIGSDGLVLIGRSPSPQADFSMRIFNADGSEGLMCGNASRCIGKYVYERRLTDKRHIRLLTASGIKTLDLTVPDGVFVSMGNPHYVIFVHDIETVDIAREGSRLERHPRFPERCNIEFAQIREDGIRTRVWERGSGITMACGTGACATAVAAAITGRSGRQSRIIMDGGTLDIEWRESDGHVYLSGPAVISFEGTAELPTS